jgi:hypothetical protein
MCSPLRASSDAVFDDLGLYDLADSLEEGKEMARLGALGDLLHEHSALIAIVLVRFLGGRGAATCGPRGCVISSATLARTVTTVGAVAITALFTGSAGRPRTGAAAATVVVASTAAVITPRATIAVTGAVTVVTILGVTALAAVSRTFSVCVSILD